MSAEIVKQALALVTPQFRLPINHGWHGIQHWTRVWHNARFLCAELGLDPTVPCWFAYLHDSQRFNENADSGHGFRARNKIIDWVNAGQIKMPGLDLDLLLEAVERHSDGTQKAHPIVQVCWDADRLDLWRVHIKPDPRKMCTEPAKRLEVIKACMKAVRK